MRSGSNFMNPFEDCQSPTNQPVINTKEVQINDDTLRNLTLIEIEQLLHINQRSLKDYPTMPYPQDINLTSYLQNNLKLHTQQFHRALLRRYGCGRVDTAITSSTGTYIHRDTPFYHEQWAPITHTKFGSNTMEQPTQYGSNNTEADIFFADGLSDVRADLKIYESIIINFFACDDNTIFDLHFTPPLNQQTCGRPILHSRVHAWRTEITQCILGAPPTTGSGSNFMTPFEDCQSPTNQPVINTKEVQINDDTLRNLTLIEIEQLLHINQRSLKDYPTMPYPQDINLTSYLQNNLEIPSHARKYLKQCENHLTILRKNAPPLQWDVVTLDRGIKDKSIVRPWYKFLRENNFHHGDERLISTFDCGYWFNQNKCSCA
ncbi:hypothetical protein JHK82_022705 [Glycine max]|nr:hypothetical protein JHK82_022705 [Glycine max]